MFVKEYTNDIFLVRDDKCYQEIYDSLPIARRAKVDKCKSINTKRMSLLTGYMLQSTLPKFGYSADDIVLSDNGKPYIPGNGIYFSLSHSSIYVLLTVSDVPIGCDIQQIGDYDVLGLAKFVFTPAEFDLVKSSDDMINTFYRIWTIKEAYLKCIGTGLTQPFDSFEVNPFANTISEKGYTIYKSEIVDGIATSIVVRND